MRFRSLALVLSLAVLAAGCGGSGGDSGEDGSSNTTSKPIATTAVPYVWPPATLPNRPADVQKALAVSLTREDLPEGWEHDVNEKQTSVPQNFALDESFVQCLFGTSPAPLTGYAVSGLYTNPDTIAQSFVRVTETNNETRRDFDNVKADRARQCMNAQWERQQKFPTNVTVTGRKFGEQGPSIIDATPLAPPDNSTDTKGFRLIVPSPGEQPTHLDMFAFGSGRVVAVLIFQKFNTDVDPLPERTALVRTKMKLIQQTSTTSTTRAA